MSGAPRPGLTMATWATGPRGDFCSIGVPGERTHNGANHPIRHRQAEVGLLLHHDGLAPILEEVADAFVAAVEGPPHGGVRRDRILRCTGRMPVRTNQWA
ncbi:MAG: hypothetical protein WCK89_24025 [bacterium]